MPARLITNVGPCVSKVVPAHTVDGITPSPSEGDRRVTLLVRHDRAAPFQSLQKLGDVRGGMLSDEQVNVVLNDAGLEHERTFLTGHVSEESIKELGDSQIDEALPVSRGPHEMRVDPVTHGET